MVSVRAMMFDELGYDPDAADAADAADARLAGRDGLREPAAVAAGLAVGEVAPARVGPRLVAVARLASGRLVVVDDVCPHDGGRISDGWVEGESLVCARHGWELEVCEGPCLRKRPATGAR